MAFRESEVANMSLTIPDCNKVVLAWAAPLTPHILAARLMAQKYSYQALRAFELGIEKAIGRELSGEIFHPIEQDVYEMNRLEFVDAWGSFLGHELICRDSDPEWWQAICKHVEIKARDEFFPTMPGCGQWQQVSFKKSKKTQKTKTDGDCWKEGWQKTSKKAQSTKDSGYYWRALDNLGQIACRRYESPPLLSDCCKAFKAQFGVEALFHVRYGPGGDECPLPIGISAFLILPDHSYGSLPPFYITYPQSLPRTERIRIARALEKLRLEINIDTGSRGKYYWPNFRHEPEPEWPELILFGADGFAKVLPNSQNTN